MHILTFFWSIFIEIEWFKTIWNAIFVCPDEKFLLDRISD